MINVIILLKLLAVITVLTLQTMLTVITLQTLLTLNSRDVSRVTRNLSYGTACLVRDSVLRRHAERRIGRRIGLHHVGLNALAGSHMGFRSVPFVIRRWR